MKNLSFLLVIILLISSCGPSTKVTASWTDTKVTPIKFKSIAIIGITNRVQGRKAVEEALETQMLKDGINGLAALHFLPPTASKESITKEIVVEFLKLNKVDGVLAVSLLRIDDTRRYVPGNYYYMPNYNLPLTDYYGQMTNYVYSTGYYTGSEQIFMECNLYEFPSEKLVWSAQSKTHRLSSLHETASDFAKVIVYSLIKDDVVQVKK